MLKFVAGVGVLVGTAWTVGTGPFLHGLLAISWPTIIVAVGLTAVATSAAVWRWRTVAAGFGIPLRWRGAVAAYYRSQFVNAVLPGGVVGDVHRAYRHGRRSGSVALAARAVATERIAGQLVQCAIVAVAVLVLGMSSPLHALAWVVGAIAVLVTLATAAVAAVPRGRRLLRREAAHLAQLFGRPGRSASVVASSIAVVAAHSALFVVACLATGIRAPLIELVALALIALTIGALPINVGGWGPREGAAASAFAAVGLGASAGVAASITFGVLATIAVLPGAFVLIVNRARNARESRRLRDDASGDTAPPPPAISPAREEVPA
jgi:uncharacterized membrane protein YbhN (UPF0104 family)